MSIVFNRTKGLRGCPICSLEQEYKCLECGKLGRYLNNFMFAAALSPICRAATTNRELAGSKNPAIVPGVFVEIVAKEIKVKQWMGEAHSARTELGEICYEAPLIHPMEPSLYVAFGDYKPGYGWDPDISIEFEITSIVISRGWYPSVHPIFPREARERIRSIVLALSDRVPPLVLQQLCEQASKGISVEALKK